MGEETGSTEREATAAVDQRRVLDRLEASNRPHRGVIQAARTAAAENSTGISPALGGHRRKVKVTRMWVNAQRDGRPAYYRWRPLFNAAVWLTPTILACRAVTLPRRETR